MAIIRTPRKATFSIIDNQVFQDRQLSFQGMGLLAYLLSKPDHWTVTPRHLATVTEGSAKKTAINGVHAILRELKACGFVIAQRLATGKMDYLVYDTPQEPQHPQPDEANPRQAERSQVNTDSKKRPNTSSNVELVDFDGQAADVVQHLNAVAGRKFSIKASTTKQNIIARLKEGVSVADCCLVIDFKTQEWGGDAKMSQYLRPETLFAPSKFPGYLGAAQAVRSGYAKAHQSNSISAAADNIRQLQDRFYQRDTDTGVCVDGDCSDVPDPLARLESTLPG